MQPITRRTFVAGTASTVLAASTPLHAQSFPTQMVRLAVPFSAGSMTDILARSTAEQVRQRWNQTVLIENRPGLAGVVSVAKAAADGYTLMLTSNGHTVIGVVNKNAGVDPIRDFVAVSKVASMPSILIVPASSPYATLKDLIDAAKAKPGILNYASAGLGSATGIAAELLRQITATDMALVPHRGMPEAQTSVMRGDSALGFTFFNVGGDLVQSGMLRALAVTGTSRMAQLPAVPTFAEAGFPAFQYDAWFGVFAPAGTPPAIITQVNKDINGALMEPQMTKIFAPQGVNLEGGSAVEFAALVKADTERFAKLFPAG